MQVVPTGATENRPAVQFVHVSSAVGVQPAALRLVPAAQVVQVVQAVALAADQLTPAVQFEQTVSLLAVQVEDRYLPAEQLLDAHAVQGAKPVAEKVLPASQGVAGAHAVEFQT